MCGISGESDFCVEARLRQESGSWSVWAQTGWRALLWALVVVLNSASVCRGETWAEKLGYPSGSRVVILNVGDVGICWEANLAARRILSQGAVLSASVVSPAPWVDEFADWSRGRSGLDLGLSLALHNPYPNCRWRLISPPDLIPSLLDREGFPSRSPMQMAMNAVPHEVELELVAQLHRARDSGIVISHLNSLDGAVWGRTDLVAVMLTIARQQWLPAPVVDLTPAQVQRFKDLGFDLSDDLLHLVDHYPLPKLDDIQFLPDTKTLADKQNRFREQLLRMPPGLVQINVHPLVPSDGVALLDPHWQQRVWDLEVLTDPRLQQTVREAKIELTNWREVMARFERPGNPGSVSPREASR